MGFDNLTDNEKKKCIYQFKARCFFFHRTYKINRTLFEDNRKVFENFEFAKIMNSSLVDYLLLLPHIITDPADFNKKDKNLSVFFFLQWSWKPEVKRKLEMLAQKLKDFVDFEQEDNP